MGKATATKKEMVYWIEFSMLNGRDSNTFIATDMEVLDNGFVKAVGKYKRRKNQTTLLIPTTSIISIEEAEATPEEAEAEEKV